MFYVGKHALGEQYNDALHCTSTCQTFQRTLRARRINWLKQEMVRSSRKLSSRSLCGYTKRSKQGPGLFSNTTCWRRLKNLPWVLDWLRWLKEGQNGSFRDDRNHLEKEQTSPSGGKHSRVVRILVSQCWEWGPFHVYSLCFSLLSAIPLSANASWFSCLKTRLVVHFNLFQIITETHKIEDKTTEHQRAGLAIPPFEQPAVSIWFQPRLFFFLFFSAELVRWVPEVLLTGFVSYLAASWYFLDY